MVAKIGRTLLKTFCWLLLLSVVITLVFDRLVQFRMDDKDLTNYFQSRHVSTRIDYYEVQGRKVRYVSTGDNDSSKAAILFIHGAPSSSSYWKAYMADSSLLQRADMYAVDRPGYGYSGLGEPLPDIAAQAAAIKPILDSMHKTHRLVILAGASFGSPIVCRLAMDHPELSDGLVILAPPLGPGQEQYFWFNNIVESPLVHWVVPRMFVSANREKVHHREGLTAMLPLWPRIHVPVSYMQGANDELVHTSNADFARTHLTNAPSLTIEMIPGRGHLIAFKEQVRITKAIMKMLDLCHAR